MVWNDIHTAPYDVPFQAYMNNGAVCTAAFLNMPEKTETKRGWFGKKTTVVTQKAGVYFYILIPAFFSDTVYDLLNPRSVAIPIFWAPLPKGPTQKQMKGKVNV